MNCKTCSGPCCLKGSNHEGDCEGYKPMSHYEQIRSMSVEEMAEFMANNVGCDDCRFFATCRSAPQDRACADKWLDWLRQEADHE